MPCSRPKSFKRSGCHGLPKISSHFGELKKISGRPIRWHSRYSYDGGTVISVAMTYPLLLSIIPPKCQSYANWFSVCASPWPNFSLRLPKGIVFAVDADIVLKVPLRCWFVRDMDTHEIVVRFKKGSGLMVSLTCANIRKSPREWDECD